MRIRIGAVGRRDRIPVAAVSMLDYAPQVGVVDVPDPYYSGEFDEMSDLVKAGCEGLLAHIREKEGI